MIKYAGLVVPLLGKKTEARAEYSQIPQEGSKFGNHAGRIRIFALTTASDALRKMLKTLECGSLFNSEEA